MERLLPSVWDADYCWGMEAPLCPDPDMPKGYVNPAHGNTLSAHLADIRTAWRKADLSLKERRAVMLRFGLDWRVVDIAHHEACVRRVIDTRLYRAVGKLVAHLNGKVFTEGDLDEHIAA